MAYCKRCHQKLENSKCGLGWCLDCNDLVSATQCKAPYWSVGVVLLLVALMGRF